MLQPQKTKICLVGDALSGGGAERVHAFLSGYFVSKGIDVHNVVVQDNVSYDFSGELLNLGLLKDKRNGLSNKLKRFLVLRKYIKRYEFDYVIDFRMRRKYIQDFFVSRFIYTVPAVYTVHSGVLEWYMPKLPWFTRLIYNNAYGIISITNKMQEHIEELHGLKNVTTIYNPVDIAYIQERAGEPFEDEGYKYIVAVGSMHENNIKQFDVLINAYANSVLPVNNVKLLILGKGGLQNDLEQLAEKMGVGNQVVFKGFRENPYIYMRNAFLYALTSKNEGLPMVLLESLVCETPAVAFDCFTGPSEIINDGVNGLLVKDQNAMEFTNALNRMFTDKKFYESCKKNAVRSIEKFSLENIGHQWLEFLKIEQN